MATVTRMTTYGWCYGKTGVVICPNLRTDLEQAKKDAEEHYVRRDREKWPNSVPQRLEWREHTSPRGYGFGNRFWTLFAERRPGTRRLGYVGDMFTTGYVLTEMYLEVDVDD